MLINKEIEQVSKKRTEHKEKKTVKTDTILNFLIVIFCAGESPERRTHSG